MAELTEREQRLMDYVAYLFGVLNIYSSTMRNLVDLFNWQHEELGKIDINSKMKEIIEVCNREFNWDAKFYESQEEAVEDTKQGD